MVLFLESLRENNDLVPELETKGDSTEGGRREYPKLPPEPPPYYYMIYPPVYPIYSNFGIEPKF